MSNFLGSNYVMCWCLQNQTRDSFRGSEQAEVMWRYAASSSLSFLEQRHLQKREHLFVLVSRVLVGRSLVWLVTAIPDPCEIFLVAFP